MLYDTIRYDTIGEFKWTRKLLSLTKIISAIVIVLMISTMSQWATVLHGLGLRFCVVGPSCDYPPDVGQCSPPNHDDLTGVLLVYPSVDFAKQLCRRGQSAERYILQHPLTFYSTFPRTVVDRASYLEGQPFRPSPSLFLLFPLPAVPLPSRLFSFPSMPRSDRIIAKKIWRNERCQSICDIVTCSECPCDYAKWGRGHGRRKCKWVF